MSPEEHAREHYESVARHARLMAVLDEHPHWVPDIHRQPLDETDIYMLNRSREELQCMAECLSEYSHPDVARITAKLRAALEDLRAIVTAGPEV